MLIDGGTEKGAELIAENVRALGFKLKDIRYLLISHEHFDHVGGIARLQQLIGATLVTSAPAGVVSSLVIALTPSAIGCSSPHGPARLGPMRS